MKVAILGYDTEGKSTYDYFKARNADITICDQNLKLKVPSEARAVLGDNYLDSLDEYDLLVRTAGLPSQKILDKNPGVESKITTQINEFFKVCPTKNIIGITGTKGKGTTSTLVTKILEKADKDVVLAGNIGVPVLSMLNKLSIDSWVVLELSSFQLSDIKYSPRIAGCLMVAPEHLNWHSDFDDYKNAKSNLFRYQTDRDVAIYFNGDKGSKLIASHGSGRKIPYFKIPGAFIENDLIKMNGLTICKTSDIKLLGEHNWQNVCAAITIAWQATQDIEAIKSTITTFSGLEHRLELVREFNEVKYYDDSFGTTPETAIVALKAFPEPKVVILGGSDKGADYHALAKTIKESNIRKVLLIGEQAKHIQSSLQEVEFNKFRFGGSDMKEIVTNACSEAQIGDIVLLSTGCASFDMFKDYKDRGDKFKQAVQQLA